MDAGWVWDVVGPVSVVG